VEVSNISKTKKSTQELSEFQGHVVFFDIQDIVMAEWIPSGQTVNQQCYLEVLMKLRERVRRKRPELWKNGWILHQDNAPAHIALSVKQCLATHNITVLQHPLYSPDLAPCDFFLFPKIKSVLKGTQFLSVEDGMQKDRDSQQTFRK
jgi:histone-lysine N-methyltransferase SETMAR